MKVLVTGGAGYIGSHVVEMLLERNYEVVVLDNLSKGYRQAVHKDATFVQGNLLNQAKVARCFAENEFDGVLHFASFIEVGESMQNPFKYLRDNVTAIMNVLEQVTHHNNPAFILSSTANLYDNPKTMPISEEETLEPGSVYGETKYWSERMLLWMERIYGLRYCALRYFNASGAHPNGHIGEAHTPETHLIPLVLQVALGQREKILIYGSDYDTPDGTCIRDYVHILDLADAHILALEALLNGKIQSRAYNLGNGTGYSVHEVIETCRKVTGHPIPAVETLRRAGDLPRLVADSTRIQQELGWHPEFNSLRVIVETAWNWHQSHPNGYDKKPLDT